MVSQVNVLLSLVLMALGCIGIILSFSVVDRRKSLISLGLGGLIILVGLIQLGASATESWRWQRRLQSIRQDRQKVDIDKLREDFKKKADEAQNRMKEQNKKP